jgi:hypothetical protein
MYAFCYAVVSEADGRGRRWLIDGTVRGERSEAVKAIEEQRGEAWSYIRGTLDYRVVRVRVSERVSISRGGPRPGGRTAG